jgi:hypothetical protein
MFRSEVHLHQTVTPYGTLRNTHSNKCMTVTGTANTGAVQTTCDANNTLQRWMPRYPTADMLRNAGSAKCLAVTNTANNSAVVQTNCSTAAVPQRWTYP